ncbi:MAG: type II secretion system F family protein [Candidatus Omnitrophica bacterium]|nr:type II secretion system F family protein [Candidatus Omnitrophota bacterium]
MTTYRYKAKKGLETVEGVMEGLSQDQVIERLEQQGFLPVRVVESSSKGEKKASTSNAALKPLWSKRVPVRDIHAFTRQMASLLRAKVRVARALEILARESSNPQVRQMLAQVHEEVKGGRQLSEALGLYPKNFSRVYLNMVASGEKGGMLHTIMERLADFADREEEIRSRVRSAMAYPLFMAAVGAVTIFVMMAFVMPRLVGLFAESQQALPAATQVLIQISQFLKLYWYWVLLGVCGLGIAGYRYWEKFGHRNPVLARFLLALPGLGAVLIQREMARFCRTLGTLVQNGIPIRDAVDATVPTLGNCALEQALSGVRGELDRGATVAQSLGKVSYFPGFVISLIGVGEEAGDVGSSLLEVASNYEKRLDEQVKILSSLIEPLMILVVGLVVGYIVMAMLLPIFDLSLK